LTEPPDADPHVRWCGRKGALAPSYPDCQLVKTVRAGECQRP
jgi:hypothetical protein